MVGTMQPDIDIGWKFEFMVQ